MKFVAYMPLLLHFQGNIYIKKNSIALEWLILETFIVGFFRFIVLRQNFRHQRHLWIVFLLPNQGVMDIFIFTQLFSVVRDSCTLETRIIRSGGTVFTPLLHHNLNSPTKIASLSPNNGKNVIIKWNLMGYNKKMPFFHAHIYCVFRWKSIISCHYIKSAWL